MFPSQPFVQPGGFSHTVPPPTTTVGYDTTIGFSLDGGVNTFPPPQPSYYPPQVHIPRIMICMYVYLCRGDILPLAKVSLEYNC